MDARMKLAKSVERHGPTIQVHSGILVPVLDPQPEHITIVDIAHALSNICRFNGHAREFYSVAQHSVLVSHIVPPEAALWGLLHDAAEAYIGDLTRPLQLWLEHVAPGVLSGIERRLQQVIAVRFGLPDCMPSIVKHADDTLLATEKRDVLAVTDVPWVALPEPQLFRIRPLSAGQAETEFLARFYDLTKERG